MPQPLARAAARRVLSPLALGLALALVRPALAADWPMFQGDASHSGVSSEKLSVPMALEWKYSSPYLQNNQASSVVSGKTLYFAGQATLYALDADTGELKWKYPDEGPIGTPTAATIKATPAVADGTVFVGASDGVLYAVDADTGVLKWQFQTGGHIRFAPVVLNDVVYFGSDDNKVYGVDAKTGKLAMQPVKVGGAIIGSPAVLDNILYFNSSDLNLYAVNANTGHVKFAFRTTNADIYASPVATDRYIYSVGGNNLYALMRSGDLRWSFEAHNPITDTPLVTDDGVYFGDKGGRFYALDLKGRETWTVTDNATRVFKAGGLLPDKPKDATPKPEPFLQLAGAVYSAPVLSGKNIIVGTNRGFLYAIDAATGKINWEYGVFSNLPTGTYPNVEDAVTIANNRLYMTSDDGGLHCFSPDSVDTEKPAIGSNTPLRATEMNGTPPILMGAVVSDEGSGINSASIKMTLDGDSVDPTYQPNSGWIYYRTPVTQPIELLKDGRHTITLSVSDWKGNVSTDSWSFVIDNKLATSVVNTPTQPNSGTQ